MGLIRKYIDEYDIDLFARKIVKWLIIYRLAIFGLGIAFISVCFLAAYVALQNALTIVASGGVLP